MSCSCKSYFDTRVCCSPAKSTWKNCPVKAQTTYEGIICDVNAYNTYTNLSVEAKKTRVLKIAMSKPYKLDRKNATQVVDWIMEREEEEYDIEIVNTHVGM